MQRIKRIAEVFIVAVALVIVGGRMLDLQAETADAASPKVLWISPSEFTPAVPTGTWYNAGSALYGNGSYHARILLPAKKSLVGITVYYFDISDTGDVCIDFSILHAGLPVQPGVNPVMAFCSQGNGNGDTSMTHMFTTYKLQANDLAYVTVNFTAIAGLNVKSIAILYK